MFRKAGLNWLIAVLVLAITAGVALAQDTGEKPENTCSDSDTQVFIDNLIALAQLPYGNSFFEWLDSLKISIASYQFKCSGLKIQGAPESDRAIIVTDGVYIPRGRYRAVMTTEGFIRVKTDSLMGDCAMTYTLAPSQARAGAETIFTSNGCTLILEVEASASWELRFVLIDD